MFAFVSYTTVALRVVNTPDRTFHPCAGSQAKVFGREGSGEGNLFGKRFSLPAVFSLLQIFIGRLQSCPARKIPPKKRLPTLGRSFGDDRPVELALPGRGGPCLEGRGIRGWRSMAGVQQPVPQQKNPRRTGDKKRPPRAESCKGVFEQSLAAAYFPT